MNAFASTSRATLPTSALFTMVAAAAIAGTLDLGFAFTFAGLHGTPPLRVLQFIGSGLLGMGSFSGGWATGAVGVICHYSIIMVATSLYLLASRRMSVLARRPFVCGPLYGVAIYLAMNFIVVPLSAAPPSKHSVVGVCGDLASHLFFVGLPVALLVRRNWLARRTTE